jgi:hypothetical protein
MNEWMSIEHWWKDTGRGKSKFSGKVALFQCRFAHHRFHMDRPGNEPGPLWWEAGGTLPQPWYDPQGGHVQENDDIVNFPADDRKGWNSEWIWDCWFCLNSEHLFAEICLYVHWKCVLPCYASVPGIKYGIVLYAWNHYDTEAVMLQFTVISCLSTKINLNGTIWALWPNQ